MLAAMKYRQASNPNLHVLTSRLDSGAVIASTNQAVPYGVKQFEMLC